MKLAIALTVLFAAFLLLSPVPDADADVPGFRATYEGMSQEELVSLLGDVYVGMLSLEVLEAAGLNVSGEDSPFDASQMRFSNTDFGLDYTSKLHEGADGRSMDVSAHYSFYLDFEFEMEAVADSDGCDAFDEEVCGEAFGFEEMSEGDSVRLKGTVGIVAEDDMRDTVIRQAYDRDVCAVDSTTLIGTFSCVFRIEAETVHEGVRGAVEIFGHKDVGAVTVVDYIYRSDSEDVTPGTEVFCIWTSREDSADVRIEFEGERSHVYVRDVGDCESGVSHGAASGQFFYDASGIVAVDGYYDAVSGGISEFVRGETVHARLSDDGLDPFREPVRESAGLWTPAMSLIGAVILIFIAVRCMHDGRFRYRRPAPLSSRPCVAGTFRNQQGSPCPPRPMASGSIPPCGSSAGPP